MSNCTTKQRLTSKDIYIEFLPGCKEQPHIQRLDINAAVTGGTFRLRVNGDLTADIAVSGTIATDITTIQSALDALPTLDTGELTVAGTEQTAITLTGSNNKWYTVIIENDAMTGNSSSDPNAITYVQQQGAITFVISSEATKFSWKQSVDTVDTTAISDYAKSAMPVSESVTFDLTVYKSKVPEMRLLFPGQQGILTIYPEGKISGNEYWAMRVLLEEGGEDFGDHEVVTGNVTGMRQGGFIIPPGSIYRV